MSLAVRCAIILHTMLKDLAKLILTTKAVLDVLKEKVDSKASTLAIQLKNFTNKKETVSSDAEQSHSKLKEKAKEELFQLLNEVNHKAQINELHLKGFIKDKLTELTNNALLDSMELNDIRAEIASLRAEIADIKAQMSLQKR